MKEHMIMNYVFYKSTWFLAIYVCRFQFSYLQFFFMNNLFGSPSGTKSACPSQQSLPRDWFRILQEGWRGEIQHEPSTKWRARRPCMRGTGSTAAAGGFSTPGSRRCRLTQNVGSQTRTCSTPVACSSRTARAVVQTLSATFIWKLNSPKRKKQRWQKFDQNGHYQCVW
jgi:hypothetical protein